MASNWFMHSYPTKNIWRKEKCYFKVDTVKSLGSALNWSLKLHVDSWHNRKYAYLFNFRCTCIYKLFYI